ncbi:transporter substrate-binding domain-containing protein [Ideonella sp.]|uniref:substrate-binding periplasmic protein n=1 Tax=Ideonella sp. TaxID=1929293 RepID=UPI002B49F373|nr:transporter substrate-binding domain-containing protein [Ideonella sp.]HJV68982.1 transporter substrate-binding domain-containing protein [Ideonella sp.]
MGGVTRAAALSVLCAGALVQAGEVIELYYFERPPYVMRRPGSEDVVGLTATPAAQAFKGAGIAFRWVQLPTVRQLVTLKDSPTPACAVGWFRNAERDQQFKFTKPIYRDRPTVALARADFTPPAATLAETLRHPGLAVLVKDGFSYGPLIDGMLAQIRPARVVTSAETQAMARMVAAQRAHLMFAAEEEATYLAEQTDGPAAGLKVVHFTDLPPGERRHILCSKAVPDEVIERLNKAITVEVP